MLLDRVVVLDVIRPTANRENVSYPLPKPRMWSQYTRGNSMVMMLFSPAAEYKMYLYSLGFRNVIDRRGCTTCCNVMGWACCLLLSYDKEV
jgi:hypothetical protein